MATTLVLEPVPSKLFHLSYTVQVLFLRLHRLGAAVCMCGLGYTDGPQGQSGASRSQVPREDVLEKPP